MRKPETWIKWCYAGEKKTLHHCGRSVIRHSGAFFLPLLSFYQRDMMILGEPSPSQCSKIYLISYIILRGEIAISRKPQSLCNVKLKIVGNVNINLVKVPQQVRSSDHMRKILNLARAWPTLACACARFPCCNTHTHLPTQFFLIPLTIACQSSIFKAITDMRYNKLKVYFCTTHLSYFRWR